MPALTPALKGLFASIDLLWPHRSRRIDGWYRSPSQGHSVGHNPGHNGFSHAIDVDKNGVNPMWIINHIARGNGVMFYIIWDVRVWGVATGWNGHPYHIPPGGSDHRNHLHIETYQTNAAEQFRGPWFGNQGGPTDTTPAPDPGTGLGSGLNPADPRDYRDAVYGTADRARFVGSRLNEAAAHILGTRQL